MNEIKLITIPPNEIRISDAELSARLKMPCDLSGDEIRRATAEIRKRAEIKVAYCITDFSVMPDNKIDLGFCVVESRSLSSFLKDSERVILFAATLGMSAERYISSLSDLSVSKGYFADAVASAMIEAVCDEAQARIAEKCGKLTNRFSPGYGDLPLEIQPALLSSLNAARLLGITLSPSLLMTPKKSVTALIGVKKHD